MAKTTATREPKESELQAPRRKKGRAGGMSQLPLTPMIDVTFQLLLYFLLTAEFRQAEGQIAGSVPQEGEVVVRPLELDNINIAIHPSGWQGQAAPCFEIGGVRLLGGAEALYDKLAGLENKEQPVVIQPMGDVAWKYIVEAFNQAVRAKFQTVGFALASSK